MTDPQGQAAHMKAVKGGSGAHVEPHPAIPLSTQDSICGNAAPLVIGYSIVPLTFHIRTWNENMSGVHTHRTQRHTQETDPAHCTHNLWHLWRKQNLTYLHHEHNKGPLETHSRLNYVPVLKLAKILPMKFCNILEELYALWLTPYPSNPTFTSYCSAYILSPDEIPLCETHPENQGSTLRTVL